MLRILHFSDIHLPPRPSTFRWSDFLHHRRIVGYLNYLIRRQFEFANAFDTVKTLEEWGRKQGFEHALFTGDISQIGAPGEFIAGKTALAPFRDWPAGLTMLPGNHDRYIPPPPHEAEGTIGAVFADWERNDLPQATASGSSWPKVTLLPGNLALISLNSIIPHRWFWNAFGEVDQSQRQALARLLTSPELAGRFLVIAIHHALFRPDGRRDDYFHGLHGADDLLETLKAVADRCTLVHGHVHRRLHLRSAETRGIPVFGAGSATYAGREAFWVYEFDRDHGRALPGTWKDGAPTLEEPAIALF